MIVKDYYRLEELESKFGITVSDVHYLVEQNKISLAFYRKTEKYLVGGWLKNGFVGYGAVNYEGMVTVDRDVGLKLFSKGKADTLNFHLCERDKINYLTGEYPFSIQIPNNYLCKWTAKSLENLEWMRIPARIYPIEADSGISMLGDTIKKIADVKLQDKSKEETHALVEKHYGKYPNRVLKGATVVLNLSEICVLSSDLDRLGLMSIDMRVSSQNLTQNSESKRSSKFDNDFVSLRQDSVT